MRTAKQLMSIQHTDYSTKNVSKELFDEIQAALSSIDFGSLEIYVQKGIVTQITVRQIKKTVARATR